MLLHEIVRRHCDVTRWSHHLNLSPNSYLLQKPNIAVISQVKKRWQSYALPDNLDHKGWKFPFFSHFAPPHPCAMLTKHFDLTQVCVWPFSNTERGNGGAGTCSIAITVMSSCFCHFPTQFVHSCRCAILLVLQWIWYTLTNCHTITVRNNLTNFQMLYYVQNKDQLLLGVHCNSRKYPYLPQRSDIYWDPCNPTAISN